MKKLRKFIKSLPREVKILLALMGLGSGPALFYGLRRLFPGVSKVMLILCIVGIVLGIALVFFMLHWLFSRGKRKREKRMAANLSDDSGGGPQSMDAKAAIKANNDKFFSAIRDMKKNVGISVYDLPWYVVIGDSGCGKTKLVNESGLTFSTGKPEGYKLGTLNYNWWFAEEAIFIDMAGRLCNPQDDADRREWLAFLENIAKGRKGFPINGVIMCVSADHLLQDPPEVLEEYANIALERLRDLQTKLGVTFATYLVITKCDKILGFMQFFDRASLDITIKNQIFGWSKPGHFGEIYDPERFKDDFQEVYIRLHDLRLRRLSDDEDEIDLGLAYSYPEEFRRLYEPIHIYVRTLFPYIKNPRAVKNLLFRGVYFTSATQEGELILKHLADRLGADAAGQFAPLEDLYPNKRPHFIKELLLRKTFPEQGLVFRNEKQVVRNKNLDRLLKVGTGVLTVLLIAVFWWSAVAFSSAIARPSTDTEDLAKARTEIHSKEGLLAAHEVSADIATLAGFRTAARFLHPLDPHAPIRYLERAKAGLIEESLIEALREVDKALRKGVPPAKAQAYRTAVLQYMSWNSCHDAELQETNLNYDSFKALCELADKRDSVTHLDGFVEAAKWYFRSIADQDRKHLARNPAQLLARAGIKPGDTLASAIGHIKADFLQYYATLSAQHADPDVQEWYRLYTASGNISKTYQAMIDSTSRIPGVGTLDQLVDYKSSFVGDFDVFSSAVDELEWRRTTPGASLQKIPTLGELLLKQRAEWIEYQAELRTAGATCGNLDTDLASLIQGISDDDAVRSTKGLDRQFWENLREGRFVESNYDQTLYEPETFAKLVKEVPDQFPDILQFVSSDTEGDPARLSASDDVKSVRGYLKPMRDGLDGMDTSIEDNLGAETLEGWNDELRSLVDGSLDRTGVGELPELAAFWKSNDLTALRLGGQDLLDKGAGTRLLSTIEARLNQLASPDDWGVAQLVSRQVLGERVDSSYTIASPTFDTGGDEKPVSRSITRTPSQPSSRRGLIKAKRGAKVGQSGSTRTSRAKPASSNRGRRVRRRGSIPACATHAFLTGRADGVIKLLYWLSQMENTEGYTLYLVEDNGGRRLSERCEIALEAAGKAYMEAYVRAWTQAYAEFELSDLSRLREDVRKWGEFDKDLGGRRGRSDRIRRLRDEYEVALREVLEAIAFSTFEPEYGSWLDSFDSASEARDVEGWMGDAIDSHWIDEGYPDFSDVDVPPGDEAPWDLISSELGATWEELLKSIQRASELPRRFDEDAETIEAVSWGELEKLRKEFDLTDETLTERLIEFEESSRNFLSQRLTSIVRGISKRHLGDRGQSETGWPYLFGMGDKNTAQGLKTVKFSKFTSFLKEMVQMTVALGKLDERLPENVVGYKERRTFVRGCKKWYEFLGLSESEAGIADGLDLKIDWEDILQNPNRPSNVDETCQFAADRLVLDLGSLRVTQGSSAVDQVVISCQSENRSELTAQWNWNQDENGRVLTVKLQAPLNRVRILSTKTLGEHSPLAFCAYLQAYGQPVSGSAQQWSVFHTFDVEMTDEMGALKQTVVGEELRFTLTRKSLPTPIKPLEELKGVRGDRRGSDR